MRIDDFESRFAFETWLPKIHRSCSDRFRDASVKPGIIGTAIFLLSFPTSSPSQRLIRARMSIEMLFPSSSSQRLKEKLQTKDGK